MGGCAVVAVEGRDVSPRSTSAILGAEGTEIGFDAKSANACFGAKITDTRFGSKSSNPCLGAKIADTCFGAEARARSPVGVSALEDRYLLPVGGTTPLERGLTPDTPPVAFPPLSSALADVIPLSPSERGVWHVVSVHGADHFAVASHRRLTDAGASKRFWDAYVLMLRGLDARGNR
jgi:hypothetical protein